jgi:site-specific DNA-methyltransferase (adenine-specific)
LGGGEIYNPQNLIYNPRIAKRNNKKDMVYNEMGATNFSEYSNYPTDIIKFSKDSNGFHPTQKPVALFEYLIKTYTNENDLVLDNCSGSGTTAIACLNTNRNYILIEKEPKYFFLSKERIAKHKI